MEAKDQEIENDVESSVPMVRKIESDDPGKMNEILKKPYRISKSRNVLFGKRSPSNIVIVAKSRRDSGIEIKAKPIPPCTDVGAACEDGE